MVSEHQVGKSGVALGGCSPLASTVLGFEWVEYQPAMMLSESDYG
jgi:hypothetical protein